MVFVAESLAVSLVTTHVELRSVASRITTERVYGAAIETVRLLCRLGNRRPHVVVSSLNLHAGEGGLVGKEEAEVLVPAMDRVRVWAESRCMGLVIDGPKLVEVAFRLALDGAYDDVVAMCHDQATIPLKLCFFGRAVNVTAGLPIVRTSVDHETAFDIAGKGMANAGSMLEA